MSMPRRCGIPLSIREGPDVSDPPGPLLLASGALLHFHAHTLSDSIRSAIRVARLTQDYAAVWWLTREMIDVNDKQAYDRLAFEMYEIYQDDFDSLQRSLELQWVDRRTISELPRTAGKPKTKDGQVLLTSISQIEHDLDVLAVNIADPTCTLQDKLELLFRQQQRRNIIERVKATVYDYLVKTEVRLTFEDHNADVFTEHIAVVNALIAKHAPDVATMFTAAYERLDDPNPESLHQAATSCRRILKAVADYVFPPQDPTIDSSGVKRLLGEEQYVNRLLAYAESRLPGTFGDTWQATLNDLSARLDSLNALTSKGVHAPDIALFEARHCAMQTWL
jgi:hypothetical protein